MRSRLQVRVDRLLHISPVAQQFAQVDVALGQVKPDLHVVGVLGGDRGIDLDGTA